MKSYIVSITEKDGCIFDTDLGNITVKAETEQEALREAKRLFIKTLEFEVDDVHEIKSL